VFNLLAQGKAKAPMDGNSLFSLIVRDKAALYASYMPFIQGGGLFLPTTKPYQLGDAVFIMLQVLKSDSAMERLAVAGKIVWLTPQGAQGNTKPGIGIQFSGSSSKTLSRIEKLLGDVWLNSDRKTFTL